MGWPYSVAEWFPEMLVETIPPIAAALDCQQLRRADNRRSVTRPQEIVEEGRMTQLWAQS